MALVGFSFKRELLRTKFVVLGFPLSFPNKEILCFPLISHTYYLGEGLSWSSYSTLQSLYPSRFNFQTRYPEAVSVVFYFRLNAA